MKIKKITWQLRRDFTAIFECEHCGFEEKRDGYDDAFFHRNVIPSMKCDKCGKTAGDDHWEMIKARVFITLFLVWVCFAIWGKYVS